MRRIFSLQRIRESFTSELFTPEDIRRIFVPLLLDQFFIHLIAVISASLVSSIGQEAMAAVSMVGTLGFIVSCTFIAISMGGSVLIAQARGAGDREALARSIGQTTAIGTCFGAVVSVIMYTFAPFIVGAIYPRAEPLLKEYAITYLRLMMISQLPYSIFHAIFTAFRSVGDSRSSLVLTVFINLAHLILSVLFINVMQMGIRGSGYSYITARGLGCIVALFWLWLRRDQMHVKARHFFHMDRKTVSSLFRLGVPFGVEQMVFQGGMLLVQMYLSRWGATPQDSTMAIAAHGVAGSYFSLILAPANTVTTLCATVCGQCFGAKLIQRAQQYCRSFIRYGRFVALVSILLFLPTAPWVIRIYHANPDALPMIYSMLLAACAALPVLWMNANVIPSFLRSAGDVRFTTLISLISLGIGRVGMGFLFTIVLDLGPLGIWLGQDIEWAIRFVCMEYRYKSGIWEKTLQKMQAQKENDADVPKT